LTVAVDLVERLFGAIDGGGAAMTTALRKAFEAASPLPDQERDQLPGRHP
jgi:hypothetical protein